MTTVKIYGARGSSPYDSEENIRYGGNTSCYLVKAGRTALILDAGTGIIAASKDLLKEQPDYIYLALSHTHHDHVEGLGLSAFAYMPGLDIRIIGNDCIREGLEERFNSRNFPVRFGDLKGIDHPLIPIEGRLSLEDMVVQAEDGNHPGGVLGYRIEAEGCIIAYATDHEFDFLPDRSRAGEEHYEKYRVLIRDADLLIADAVYTREEYESGQVWGFGHSFIEQILDLAAPAGVKHVLAAHHSVMRTDKEIDTLRADALDYCKKRGYKLRLDYAAQGMVIELGAGAWRLQ